MPSEHHFDVSVHDLSPLDRQRHSLAHLMAAAVQQLFPDAQFGVGPVVELGCYYDFLLPRALTPEDFGAIEERMREMIKAGVAFERSEMPREQAIAWAKERGQSFKQEIIEDLPTDAAISFYKSGEFTDLCKGPHVASAKEIAPDSFKVDRLAGAYWRGDETRPMLQRLYLLAFETKAKLDEFLHLRDEAEKRDHRKLGQQLDLFTFSPLVGSGLPLFTPKGCLVRKELDDFVWDLMKPYGYQRVWIPHLAKVDLYRTSGHWDKFSDDIFHVSSKKSDEQFVLKPMNCPHHTQIYAGQPRSYRDLPLRYSEVTTVYRDENTGQLAGLSRVRSITQDDAHLFCRPDQIEAEAKGIYEIVTKFYAAFNMPLRIRLSVHDPAHMEKYLGSPEIWERSEGTLRKLLEGMGEEFETGVGEAAFYGPKIDFMAQDAIGREWQLATIQLDFNQPERFQLEYTDSDGMKKRPVMIHRAISGSIERFLGVLIEHFAGAFPTWLSPVQVLVANVGAKHEEHCGQLAERLRASGLRVELNLANETVGNKIRQAEHQKTPYTLVIGDREMASDKLAIRVRGRKELVNLAEAEFISRLKEEIAERRINLLEENG